LLQETFWENRPSKKTNRKGQKRESLTPVADPFPKDQLTERIQYEKTVDILFGKHYFLWTLFDVLVTAAVKGVILE
jgi:hypothetical protein